MQKYYIWGMQVAVPSSAPVYGRLSDKLIKKDLSTIELIA